MRNTRHASRHRLLHARDAPRACTVRRLIIEHAAGSDAAYSSKKKLTVKDMRLPWQPIYELLKGDLFMPRRQFDMGCVYHCSSIRGADDGRVGILLSAWG
jgi:hypothetical protein